MTFLLRFSLLLALLLTSACRLSGNGGPSAKDLVIVCSTEPTYAEYLAAREIRRYVYARSGLLAPIAPARKVPAGRGPCIVVGRKDSRIVRSLAREAGIAEALEDLGPQQYALRTIANGRAIHLVAGGDDAGTFYGAYRLAEYLGVRFYLHGDTIPDDLLDAGVLGLDAQGAAQFELDELGRPLFDVRGILPFHGFAEGPDWWNIEEYKTVIGQLPKLRMNFFGLHTYPEASPCAEPTVWIGPPEAIEKDGRVRSSYPASYHNTLRDTWGYASARTGSFAFGASEAFPSDVYGPDVMEGLCPWPESSEQCNALFERTGALLSDAFLYALRLGVRTSIGTETPLTVPEAIAEQLRRQGADPDDPETARRLYEGMFRRIMKTHPLDYYWLWTPEWWLEIASASQAEAKRAESDLRLAVTTARKLRPPFLPAMSGWVLGPPSEPTRFDASLPKEVPFSCVSRNEGKAPIDLRFAEIAGRPKWAIPWLEDGANLVAPQLWAGRARKDAADAARYGCTGLIGLHWRRRGVGPTVAALAKAAWSQSAADAPSASPEAWGAVATGALGGAAVRFDNPMPDVADAAIYQTIREEMTAYNLAVPNGVYTVTLKFCEPRHYAPGQRIFGVRVQDQTVLPSLDIYAKVGRNEPLDYVLNNVFVLNERLKIDFLPQEGAPAISAIVVEGTPGGIRPTEGHAYALRINCGGGPEGAFSADFVPSSEAHNLPTDDFYRDWALTEFGPQAAPALASLFEGLDSRLPEPTEWNRGPGALRIDPRAWSEVAPLYGFVAEMEGLRETVQGAGNLERFDYWLNSFRFMQATARVGCALGALETAMTRLAEQDGEAPRRAIARAEALPARLELARQWREMVARQMATICATDGLGTLANLEQHSRLKLRLLDRHDAALESALGEPLPPEAKPDSSAGALPERLVVLNARPSLSAGEALRLKVLIQSNEKPSRAVVRWRALGVAEFSEAPLERGARNIYAAALPPERTGGEDFEYYIEACTASGNTLRFPPTAPTLNQTVVVMPRL